MNQWCEPPLAAYELKHHLMLGRLVDCQKEHPDYSSHLNVIQDCEGDPPTYNVVPLKPDYDYTAMILFKIAWKNIEPLLYAEGERSLERLRAIPTTTKNTTAR